MHQLGKWNDFELKHFNSVGNFPNLMVGRQLRLDLFQDDPDHPQDGNDQGAKGQGAHVIPDA